MDWISHISPCFLPLLVVLLPPWISLLLPGRRRDSSSSTKKEQQQQLRQRTSDVALSLLTKLLACLAVLSLVYAIARKAAISPFPAEDVKPDLPGVPFLPRHDEPSREAIASTLLERAREAAVPNNNGAAASSTKNVGHVLITGASKGIGRAVAVEMARRFSPRKPLILTSRNVQSLELVADDLRTYYNATVTVVASDLSKPGEARRLFQRTTVDRGLYVDVLVLNAGMGLSGNHVDMDPGEVESLVRLNVESVSVLAGLYGSEMQVRTRRSTSSETEGRGGGGGRIMIVSSLTGTVPGVPGAAAYAATKSYLRSFAWGLAAELESDGVAVTCVLPGATQTDFAQSSNMESAAVWYYPLTVARNVEDVARHAVDATVRGYTEVFPGRFMDAVFVKVVVPLMPPRFVTWFMGFSWRPWPFRFLSGWMGQEEKKNSMEQKEL